MLIALESTGGPFPRARVAQLAEQGTLNPKVQGSIPCASTKNASSIPQWLRSNANRGLRGDRVRIALYLTA